ncbi:MAG: hypothetical protein HQM10_23905 [Candidatus Riflebacteria bacterium]|nr:hypothetical protein [Candidatus Riflebacteria bacterium]
MLAGYTPILRAPSEKSSEWYKEFHNIYYLSQLTNILLLSYVDSFIEIVSKQTILKEKKEFLVKNKTISIDNNNGIDILTELKSDEIKSIDIENFLDQIIEKIFKENMQKSYVCLTAMGLSLENDLNKDIRINIKDLLSTTSAKNWYEVIKCFLNVWEFLFLYSIIETTIKKILSISGQTKEEELLEVIMKKYPLLRIKLESELSLNEQAMIDLWKLYTEFRNIYSHSHGIITQMAKSNIGGKLDKFKKGLDDRSNNFLIDTDKIFQNNLLVQNKFYLIKDVELNIYRNFIIAFIEKLDEIYSSPD